MKTPWTAGRAISRSTKRSPSDLRRNGQNCAILDCEFDDSFYHGVGGTAYAGWEVAYDCLMDNVTTRNLRHAPLVQWSAAGNVVRNSRFYGCDAHWHSGWTMRICLKTA